MKILNETDFSVSEYIGSYGMMKKGDYESCKHNGILARSGLGFDDGAPFNLLFNDLTLFFLDCMFLLFLLVISHWYVCCCILLWLLYRKWGKYSHKRLHRAETTNV